MAEITVEQIKQLREKTGISMMNCKKALQETSGNEEEAIKLLRKKGELKAQERSERTAGEGTVESYIHSNGKIGVLVQLGCETDFVAKNQDFVSLARDISMHIAAMNPLYINPEDVPNELVEKEIEIWKEQLAKEGKPQNMLDKIIEGKSKKFKEEISLTTQNFVKQPDLTIGKLITDHITKLGENIVVKRFSRFSIN